MRVRTELSEMPQEYTVIRQKDTAIITFYTDVQREERDDGPVYTAISWTLTCPWAESLERRVQNNVSLWRDKAMSVSYDEAASSVRAHRDKLLQNSDAQMAIDRLGLTVPEGSTFSEWLSFLHALGDALTGKWKVYRQLLRDLPQQTGFPYEVEWPKQPDK